MVHQTHPSMRSSGKLPERAAARKTRLSTRTPALKKQDHRKSSLHMCDVIFLTQSVLVMHSVHVQSTPLRSRIEPSLFFKEMLRESNDGIGAL